MNILYVLQYFPVYGGGETVTVKLANELVKRKHNVYIAYTMDNYSDPMPYNVDSRVIKKKFKNLAFNCSKEDINALHDYIKENNIDIVINQWADKKLCYKATIGTEAKLIKCYHISTFYPYVPTNKSKRFLRMLFPQLWDMYYHKKQIKAHKNNLRYCDKYVFLTKYAVEELTKENIFCEDKITAISNPATYDEYSDSTILKRKEKIVLYVGRMIEYNKRMTYMLDAWKLLADRKLLDDWKLVMIGEGPDKSLVLDKVKKEHVPNVEFIGFCNPLDYYKKSSILLMSSYIEGFGMVILEGMQNGVVPIVTNSFSAARAIIDNGESGIIVKNNDINLYAEKIHSLMTNNMERERLAIGAIEKSREFDIKEITNQWESLFKSLKK